MDSSRNVGETIVTPANVVTMLRICLIPVFVIVIISPWPSWFPEFDLAETIKPWLAALIFIILSLTDTLDGYLARKRNEITTFGKFVDPLADKMLVSAALLALIELQVLPSWVALIIICREFIVSGLRMVAASEGVVIAASRYGKAKTFFQMVSIVLFIIKDSFVPEVVGKLYIISWLVMLIALVLTIVSMIDYFVKSTSLFSLSTSEVVNNRSGYECNPEIYTGISDASLDELAQSIVAAASRQGVTLATAESLTGGLISARLTSVPGSSTCVKGGIVSYTNEIKHNLLGVPEAILEKFGAVSEEVVACMALGVCEALCAELGVAVSGIAGPGGAEPAKPVGTVWLSLVRNGDTYTELQKFSGNREEIRLQTERRALELLCDSLGV